MTDFPEIKANTFVSVRFEVLSNLHQSVQSRHFHIQAVDLVPRVKVDMRAKKDPAHRLVSERLLVNDVQLSNRLEPLPNQTLELLDRCRSTSMRSESKTVLQVFLVEIEIFTKGTITWTRQLRILQSSGVDSTKMQWEGIIIQQLF